MRVSLHYQEQKAKNIAQMFNTQGLSFFFAAGTDSVIGSLWNIPDMPTASLITKFNANLSKNTGKAIHYVKGCWGR